MNPTQSPLMLDCSACKTERSMTATKTERFSPVLRLIGGVLLIPSFLGLAFTALMFVSWFSTFSEIPSGADTDYMGTMAEGGAILVFIVVVGVVSLVGGLLGWLLLQNRKVWKCLRCGFILDRA